MKKRYYSALIGVFLCFTTLIAAQDDPTEDKADYKHVPVKFSLFPMIDLNDKTVVNFSPNLFGDYSARLDGVSLGFGVSIIGEDLAGAQLAGIAGIAGRNVNYLQGSGVFNSAGGDVSGLQVAGWSNFSGGNVSGVQVSGLCNYSRGRMKGLQGSGIFNYAGGFSGMQLSVVNVSSGNSSGLQMSVANVATEKTGGMQLGIVNYASDMTGVQLGLINVSRNMEGIPLGIVSIVTNGVTHFDVWGDEMGFTRFAAKHGTKHFYGIYTVGTRGDLKLLSAGMGSGVSVPFDRFFVSADVIAYNVASRENYLTKDTLLHVRSRVYAGIKLMEHLSLFAGISYNYATPIGGCDEEVSILKTVHGRDYKYNDDNVHWPGFFLGVQM